MNNKVEVLNLDDVICLTDEDLNSPTDQIKYRIKPPKFFSSDEFINGLLKLMSFSTEVIESFGEGIPCRVMTTRQTGWRFGKIRLKIELQFIPDESSTEETVENFDSPLDEIRKTVEL